MKTGRPVIALILPLLAAPLLPAAARADVPAFGSVRGVIVDEAGRTLAGATVILTGASGGPGVATALTDAEGRFVIGKLPPRKYELLAIFGDVRKVTRGIEVSRDETVELRATLPVSAEVITIREHVAPPTVPVPIEETVRRVPPYSDAAIDANEWMVAWLLLDIDAEGKVTAFRFLRRPGRDLAAIAEREVWRLRFEPSVDAGGQAVASKLLWKMEWPSYWWFHTKYMAPNDKWSPPRTMGIRRGAPQPQMPVRGAGEQMRVAAETGRPVTQQGRLMGGNMLLPGDDVQVPLPPCKGSGPLLMGEADPVYRDCSPPEIERALTEPLITRAP